MVGRKVDQMVIIILKEWKWVGIVVGAWNLRKNPQTLLGLVAQLLISLGVKLRI
jgi:hypothetical protein